MAKRRKSDAARLDEVGRGMYSSFSTAANYLSQLYTQAMHHQRLSFQAGERHSLEKLYEWILRQQGDGARVTTDDIISFVQNELELVSEESAIFVTTPIQQQQSPLLPTHTEFPVSPNSSGIVDAGLIPYSDRQPKNSVFSSAFPSPVRQDLQDFHLGQGGLQSNNANNCIASAFGSKDSEDVYSQSRHPNTPSANDTLMDMHADSHWR